MKRELLRKVVLKFFQDDGNGEWGVTHENTMKDCNGGDAFNAFWDGQGIFHDVFEHDHEHSEFFRGEYAQNIGGEMAAMGALYYFTEELTIRRFTGKYQSHASGAKTAKDICYSYVEEGILTGWGGSGGSELRCNVPDQPPVPDSYFEEWLNDYVKEVQAVQPGERRYRKKGAKLEPWEKEQRKEGRRYKKSCTPEAIRNLHRWGYYRAQRDFPEYQQYSIEGTASVLSNFIRFWDEFCKNNSAEELASFFRTLTVYVYREGKRTTWMACLASVDGKEMIPVHPDFEKQFNITDYISKVLAEEETELE